MHKPPRSKSTQHVQHNIRRWLKMDTDSDNDTSSDCSNDGNLSSASSDECTSAVDVDVHSDYVEPSSDGTSPEDDSKALLVESH